MKTKLTNMLRGKERSKIKKNEHEILALKIMKTNGKGFIYPILKSNIELQELKLFIIGAEIVGKFRHQRQCK